jgi:hypothetical protein
MADKTSNGAPGRSDLDPFAELTRIMGFDPRVPVEASKPAAAGEPAASPTALTEPHENFSIDLEQELLGAMDDGAAQGDASEAAATVVASSSQDDEPAEQALELDLEGIEDEISRHVDAFIEADRAEEPVEQFAAEPAVVEVAAEDEEETPALVQPEPEDEFAAVSEDQSEDDAGSVSAPEGIDLDQSLEEAFAEAPRPVAARNVDWEPAPFLSARPQPPAASDASMAAVDMDFDADLDAKPDEQAVTAQLEAEYNALLGNTGGPTASSPSPEPTPSRQREAEIRTASIVSAGWRKPAAGNEDARQAPAHESRGAVTQDDDGEELADMELDGDLADALEAAAADERGQPEPQPVAAKPEPIHEDPFAALAAMAARYQTGPQENSWRETASKYEAPRPAPVEPAQPVQARSYGAPAARTAVPEIETVDVHDSAVALADDLNIPDLGYEEPPVDRYDDLDAEFNNLLNEMSTGERREPQAYAPIHRQPAYVEQRPVARPQPAPQPVRAQPAAAQPAYRDEHPAHHDERYGAISDQDFERAMAAFEAEAEDDDDEDFASPMAPIAEKRPRRGLLLAAIVGGLALVGGISAVALSFGGSGGTEIAMVKADNKPVKVRPENPGGSTVPNQDSSVYDTVSRSGAGQQSTQEQLVNTAEEPLDLPLPNDGEDEIADIAKDEDRIEPSPEPEMANQETIAVAPRKVRTMVVKSDGTLVPREEPAAEPAQAAPQAQAPQAAAPEAAAVEEEPGTEQITTGATKPSAPAAPEKVAALPAALEKPATAPAAGGWSVQVSSQPSEDGANKSLKDISRKYAGVIGSRGANIVKAEVDGKGTMYRVRIPAGSRDEAISLCGDLKAAGGSCFVTK